MTQVRHVKMQEHLLKSNDFVARELRQRWLDQGTFVVNLLSSPGSGKTTLLEATLPRLQGEHRVLVLEGDLETERDADRIRLVGVEAVQITTGGACHLEAHVISQAWQMLEGDTRYDFVFIENVGNLVCPASFDLGEHLRVVLLSVPEGDDKPAKYPKAFRTADVLAITKCDVLPYFDFQVPEATRLARQMRGDLEVIEVSARTGEGLESWLQLLRDRRDRLFCPR